MFKKVNLLFGVLLLGSLAAKSAQADTLGCVNFYDHKGFERVVLFEASLKDSSHIPDALFMIEASTSSIEVQELKNGEFSTVVEASELELIYADFYSEVLTYIGEGYNLHLVFDRSEATMNVRYVTSDRIVESSVDGSICDII